jgi:hypothetical protein
MNNQSVILKKKDNFTYEVWIHSLVWFLMICMPFLVSASKEFQIIRLLERSWIPLIYYAIIFYTNYLWAIDRYFFTRKTFLFVCYNLFIIVLFVWFNQSVKPYIFQPDLPRDHQDGSPRKMFIYFDIMFMVLPLVLAIAIKASERWKLLEKIHDESVKAKLQTELQHLKYQIQPHFFFNSLNNIYSLVDVSPEKAKETIHSLSKLMRYLLYDTNSEQVSLANEISFMQRYIELMKLRTSAHANIISSFPENDNQIVIAPLLFISLIENAFKHGIAPRGVSEIQIEMSILDKKIIFKTVNPYIVKSSADLSGSAIGLDNIKKRLDLLYPKNYEFKTYIEDDKFIALLTIDTK